MELQFEKRVCRCLNPGVREVKNEEVTQEVKLSDALPDIGRVLATWAQVVLRSKEWRGDRAAVSGGVMVWVLYEPEDGTAPRCVDSWIPFNLRWDVSGADREGTIRAMPLLRFADSRAVSPRKLMVRAGVAMLGQMLWPMEVPVFEAGQVPEDLQLLKRDYRLWVPKEAGEKAFMLDEDLELPGSASGIDKIICCTLRPEITERKVMAGKLVFRGHGDVHLIYRDGEGKLHTWDFEVPISQFQDLQEEYAGELRSDTAMAVTDLETEPEEGRLRIKCGLVCQYIISECMEAELVEDAYSPRREVSLAREELKLPVALEQRREQITAQQELPGRSGQILDVQFLPDYPGQHRRGEEISLELPGQFQTLYYDEAGKLQSATARWEGQFSLEAGENSRVSASVLPLGWGSGTSGADSMGLRGQVQLELDTTMEQGIPMVTGVEMGELQEPDPRRPSLVLIRPEGESLWDLARKWGSTVGAIRKANGIEEADGDQMLLIPVS